MKQKINLSTFLLLCTSCYCIEAKGKRTKVFLLSFAYFLNEFGNKIIIITQQFKDDFSDFLKRFMGNEKVKKVLRGFVDGTFIFKSHRDHEKYEEKLFNYSTTETKQQINKK